MSEKFPKQEPADLERDRDAIRAFQKDCASSCEPVLIDMGAQTRKALMLAQGKCFAADLTKGACFSYPGLFKIYEALSDAVPDDRIEGKVVLPVTDHGARDHMPTRLDADLVCTLHQRPNTW